MMNRGVSIGGVVMEGRLGCLSPPLYDFECSGSLHKSHAWLSKDTRPVLSEDSEVPQRLPTILSAPGIEKWSKWRGMEAEEG
jgi:hypothetical protein